MKIIPLSANNNEHFQLYKKILTNEKVVFTSSWMDKAFGIDNLKKYCEAFNSTQEGLDDFFSKEENHAELALQFKELSKSNSIHNCGYCMILNKNNDVIGGCGLIPLEFNKNNGPTKVDMCLHILPEYQKGGIGTAIAEKLLRYAFDDLDVKEVVGTSLRDHIGTYNICAGFGMIIKDHDDLKYYFVSRKMWEAASKHLDTINTNNIYFNFKPNVFAKNILEQRKDVIPNNQRSI